MLEGFQQEFLNHYIIYTAIIVFFAWIDFVTLKLWWQNKIVPVYRRPIPRSWSELKYELILERDTVLIILQHAIPIKLIMGVFIGIVFILGTILACVWFFLFLFMMPTKILIFLLFLWYS